MPAQGFTVRSVFAADTAYFGSSGQNHMTNRVDERLAELENRQTFQEDIIEHLNQVIGRQDREILALRLQLSDLANRVRDFRDSAVATAPSSDIEIPPHY